MTLERATRALRNAVDGGDMNAVPADRDETIAKIAAALQRRAKQRTRRRIGAALAVAAAFALIGTGFLVHRNQPHDVAATELGRVNDANGVTAVRGGVVETVNPGTRIAEGSELRTPDGAEAHLVFDTGTRVTLGGATRVRLVEQTKRKRFAVETGSLHAKVSKLASDERFVVSTPDAEVEVHGTVFRVSVVEPDPTCGDGTPTRLEVTEGVVAIRHGGIETRVAAGERWPQCEPPPRAAVDPPVTSAAPPPRPRPVVAASAPSAAPPPAASSGLGEQNDLFADAMRAKHTGQNAAALAKLDQLLAKYPQGQLAESATIERMRLLHDGQRVQAARDYLAQWPNGVARAEADAIVHAAPNP